MDNSRKNSLLSNEEYSIILSIVAKLGAKLYNIVKNYPTPKEYARKAIRILQTKKNIASIFLMYNPDLDPSKVYTPAEISKELTDKLTTYPSDDEIIIKSDSCTEQIEFIASNRLTEVLKKLEEMGLFDNIKGMKNLRFSSKGKRKKINIEGYPSGYKLTSDAQRIQSLLSKPECVDLIINSLIEAKLLYSYLKYTLTCSLYLYKYASDKQLYQLLKSVISSELTDYDKFIERISPIRTAINALDDQKIEEITEKSAENLLKEYKTDIMRIFLLLSISKLE
jgi:hypothetical protein